MPDYVSGIEAAAFLGLVLAALTVIGALFAVFLASESGFHQDSGAPISRTGWYKWSKTSGIASRFSVMRRTR